MTRVNVRDKGNAFMLQEVSKKIKANNRRFLNKHRKIDETGLILIKEYLNENKFKLFKLDNLQCYIKTKTGDSWTVSNSTLGRVIWDNFKMLYMKINKFNQILLKTENKNKMLESVVILLELDQKGVAVVYLDEFKYSWNNTKHYGWTVKGRKRTFSITSTNLPSIAYSCFLLKENSRYNGHSRNL